ncbi:Uncharacterised protein [Vibrio cholerae]|uniref:Uncharacterized protein n=1 Tax=Vibrio cholerae TaxID=666 RepID=A0A655YRK0_VIBCL|nr:Uncharacterised protein [Vibrio cholerae]
MAPRVAQPTARKNSIPARQRAECPVQALVQADPSSAPPLAVEPQQKSASLGYPSAQFVLARAVRIGKARQASRKRPLVGKCSANEHSIDSSSTYDRNLISRRVGNGIRVINQTDR